MQIKIWVRSKPDGTLTLRLDTKYETLDTPKVHAWGQRLVTAIERGAVKEEA